MTTKAKSEKSTATNLDKIIEKLHKTYGEFAVIKPGEIESDDSPCIPTGSLSLDLAIGGGRRLAGIYRGAFNVLWGREGIGKSTVAYHVIASAQSFGLKVAIADLEYKMDTWYAQQLGINFDDLYVIQPMGDVLGDPLAGEDIMTIIDELIKSGEFGLIVIDSAASIGPRREIEGEYGEAHVGLQARLMTQSLRKLSGVVKASQTAVLFTNQERAPIGEMQSWGPARPKQPGAKAFMHYAKLMIRMTSRRPHFIKTTSGDIIGINVRATCTKNQGAIPYRTAEFSITHGTGIDSARELLELGEGYGVVTRSGSYYKLAAVDDGTGEIKDTMIAQGLENAAKMVREDEDLANKLRARIKTAMVCQDD